MKIVVFGAGALGSIAAAHLARAGEDVALIARGPRARLLVERGVTITGLADFTVKLPIIERPEELEACDAFLFTPKTYDTDTALSGVRHLKAEMAFSVQNSLLKNEALAAVFGWDHVLGCIANFSGEVKDDGTVLFTRNVGLHLGELAGGASERVEALARTIDASGVKTIVSDNIQSDEWSKYVGWLGLTAVAVLSRLHTHVFNQDPDLARLQVTLVREAAALAAKQGVSLVDLGGTLMPLTLSTLPFEDAVAQLQRWGAEMQAAGTVAHRMSALQDLLRGRRLEIEETYGYAVRKATELGVPVPALDACYRLLAGINRSLGG